MKEKPWITLLFLLPACSLLGGFVLYPAAQALWLSFTDYNMITPTRFVGVDNYARLASDPFFWAALRNSLLYLVVVVPLLVVLPIVVAVGVNAALPGIRLFRALFYLPVVTSLVISSLIWKWVYEEKGLLNHALLSLGIVDAPVAFLTDPSLALFAVMAVTLWSGMGYYMVIYLAGLQGIPRSLYEVAALEGVSAWQQFWHITVPLLRPSMAIVAVMSSIAAMKVFEEIYVMTQGGPMAASKTLVYFIYETAFVEFEMGQAAAAGMALFAITLALSLLQLRLLRKKT
ncbi:sugar ABC transporter permease [Roseateles asaccharophilus]|uniref:Chitobiose transport system permease protein n=1 Tax=Roseateles asaccharophilus TaxID=582607 RepID=A0ABU2AD56_9BURK|nr:sugar ABC transporter permease [Roseateles asaccharophilus]MDR7334528.1 putative chitobiose transport system permease protein [Roseateles asaccharophilus]